MQLGMTVDGIHDLLLRMSQLPGGIQKKYLGAAIRKASEGEVKEVRQLTPRGPTGNLKRSVGFIIDKKKRAVTATGVIGYRRGGQNKSKLGYHAWWIENGVKDRVPKGALLKIPPQNSKKYGYFETTASGDLFFSRVEGFAGSGKFRAWADANLPQIRDRLQNVLGTYVQKAIDEKSRQDIRKLK